MRRFWLVFLLSAVTVATAGAEVSRSDLAPATQSFLPPKASVITLKQGYTIQGEILADESSSDEVAVSVTTVPDSNIAEQVAPQLTPAGVLLTTPVPVPAGVTVRR